MNSSIVRLPIVTLSLVLLTGLFTSLLLFSLQSGAFAAHPLLAAGCGSASHQACSEMPAQSAEAIPDKTDDSKRFAGTFTNTVAHVSGSITIELTIHADDSIEGNVDFSAFSGGKFFCGSGDFVGTKSGETIELHFTSDDASPACGFYQGVTFTIEAALLNNTIIHGSYSTDTGDKGIVALRQVLPLYLPFVQP